ncbi:MAG: family 43 glycosylhydrolase, partial [Oscillospiraceae bacterium]|nr:family 43 glycosylhydrolase [Oscillospiraceae bacterium]
MRGKIKALFLAMVLLVSSCPVHAFAAEPTYRVTYQLNGGTGRVPVDNTLYEAGDRAILLDGAGLTRAGYHFRGWRVGSANGPYRVPGAAIEITGDTNVYAWWSAVVSSRTQVDWSAPRLDRAAFMTEIGEYTQINLVNADSATWRSSNYSVAWVDHTGRVTAKGDGDATITATVGDKVLSCLVTVGYKAQNPMLPPAWQLYIPDGEPHVFDGVMYVYGSHDVQGGSCWSDYHVIYSEDAVHWTDAGYSFTSADLPAPYNTAINSLWAPDCVYYPPTQTYYLFLCGTDSDAEYFVAESDSPKGPFVNCRRIVYKNGALDGQRIGNIDPGVFVDDDGTVWLAIAGVDGQQRSYSTTFGSSRFRYGVFDVETATIDTNTIIDVHDVCTENGVTVPFEGPAITKFGDYYYYIYVADYKNPKPGVGYRTDVQPAMLDYLYTKDIRDGDSWQYGGTFLNANNFPAIVNTHGSIEKMGEDYFVTYHTPMGVSGGARWTRIERVSIDPVTGRIEPVLMTSSGVRPAFDLRERIQFSSAVDFSTGRWAVMPFAAKTVPSGEPAQHQVLFMSTAGQYVGFRYVDFKTAGAQSATISVRTNGDGGKVQLVSGKPGEADAIVMGEINLPNTGNEWRDVSVAIPADRRDTGVKTVYVVLSEAPSGTSARVEFDYLIFNTNAYTVTYNLNGGTGTLPVDGKLYSSGDTAYYLPASGLTRPGYMFMGWMNNRVPGATFTVTGNTTVNAWWVSTNSTANPNINWSSPRLDRAAFMTEIGWETRINLINAESAASWTSSNTAVATVDENGLVTATGNGDCTITARVGTADLTCKVTVGYKAQNPPLPPSWNLQIPDGEPHAFNGVLYVYGSHDASGSSCSTDYHVIYTEDTVHWTDAGYSFSRNDLPEPYNRVATNLWAPDCVYYPPTQKYYLFLCGTDTYCDYFVAESDSPVGPFVNCRRITYKNGPRAGQRIGNIDPGVLVDDDNTLWLAMAGVDGQQRSYTTTYGSSRFRYGVFDVATATVDWNSIIDVHDKCTSFGITVPFEGPSLAKFGDFYYFIYVADYKNPKPGTGYRTDVQPAMLDYLYTRDIHDPDSWQYGGTLLDVNNFPAIVNTHGSIEQFGGEYYVTYHTPMGANGGARWTRIDRVDIDPDTGKITPV